jgi:hypothetical protein
MGSDGGKVVSPRHPLHFTPQKHYYFYVSSFFYFNSQVHLQSVQEHSAKGVRKGTWRGAPSSAPPQVLGFKPRVWGGEKKCMC